MARKVSRLDSDQTIKAQKRLFKKLPTKARESTTLDNGKEFVKHSGLKRELRIQTYFADPYSAWQRGAIEHHNGLLRRYLPKGTDFNNLTQEELDEIVEEINNGPRKVLNYDTPKEVFQSCLGVRIPL